MWQINTTHTQLTHDSQSKHIQEFKNSLQLFSKRSNGKCVAIHARNVQISLIPRKLMYAGEGEAGAGGGGCCWAALMTCKVQVSDI